MRRHPSRLTASLVLLAALGAVTACSSTSVGPVFDDEGGREVSCMVHQSDKPGTRYTVTEGRSIGDVLPLMKYYTANGAKAFCDGAAASEADKAWGQLYDDLGGTPEKVPTIVGR